MGYYCGPVPGTTKEQATRLKADQDALIAAWRDECARRRAAQPWWRRLLCRFRWGCRRPDAAGWGEWTCRYCGRHTL